MIYLFQRIKQYDVHSYLCLLLVLAHDCMISSDHCPDNCAQGCFVLSISDRQLTSSFPHWYACRLRQASFEYHDTHREFYYWMKIQSTGTLLTARLCAQEFHRKTAKFARAFNSDQQWWSIFPESFLWLAILTFSRKI